MPLSIRCVALFQVLGLLLLLVVHDVVLLSGGFGVADSLTRNLDGGLIVKKKSVQMVPDGGTASVGSGELLCIPSPAWLEKADINALLPTCMCACLPACLPVCLSVRPSVRPSTHLHVYRHHQT